MSSGMNKTHALSPPSYPLVNKNVYKVARVSDEII